MDEIRIGLDFGTHQTKICVCRIPDEGHGQPEYEFFKFTDQKGEEQYFIPSVVQINKDDTLSYGYVDPREEKAGVPMPIMEYIPEPAKDENIKDEANALYAKYSTIADYDEEGERALVEMLKLKNEIDKGTYTERLSAAKTKYEEEMVRYHREKNLFRYFKQSTFAEYPWESNYNSDLLCIWYLAYVIFMLEEKYADGFAINMGVPADYKTFHTKRELGTKILMSAIHLVEEVYQNDLNSFLKEKVNNLTKVSQVMAHLHSLT